MPGPIALHGGGEFLPGDEPFLRAIMDLAPRVDGVVRIAVVPTAAARGRPDSAGRHGVEAFRRVAIEHGVPVEAAIVPIVDAASAADPDLAAGLATASLIHLPGGDPDVIPTLYPDTPAWAAIIAALDSGAVLAGASAGAMALAEWTWTPGGGLPGLGLVPGVIVAPHTDADSWSTSVARFGAEVPRHLAVLGLGERTAVIVQGDRGPWTVVGEGEVRWLSIAARARGDGPIIAREGDRVVP